MIVPDVNVLLYAFRPDTNNHGQYHAWLGSVLNGNAPYGMSPQVLFSVIRIATHPRIFAKTTPLNQVVAFASLLLGQPHCQIVNPGPRHWTIFTDLCLTSKARGNLIADAWPAALAIESGCDWITTDGDYARFRGLTWRAPF